MSLNPNTLSITPPPVQTKLLSEKGLIDVQWANYFQGLSQKTQAIRSVAYQGTANQSLTSGTPAALTFDTNLFDFGKVHSTTVNPTRFTATAAAGFYLALAQWKIASNAVGALATILNVNGSVTVPQMESLVNQDAGTQVVAQAFGLVQLNIGDYVEFIATETAAATTTLVNFTWGALILLSAP